MKISMLYVLFIFISTCLRDIHVLPGVVTHGAVSFGFLFLELVGLLVSSQTSVLGTQLNLFSKLSVTRSLGQ